MAENIRNSILKFDHIIVDANNPNDSHCKAVADIDNDGYGELLAASSSGNGLIDIFDANWNNRSYTRGKVEL